MTKRKSDSLSDYRFQIYQDDEVIIEHERAFIYPEMQLLGYVSYSNGLLGSYLRSLGGSSVALCRGVAVLIHNFSDRIFNGDPLVYSYTILKGEVFDRVTSRITSEIEGPLYFDNTKNEDSDAVYSLLSFSKIVNLYSKCAISQFHDVGIDGSVPVMYVSRKLHRKLFTEVYKLNVKTGKGKVHSEVPMIFSYKSILLDVAQKGWDIEEFVGCVFSFVRNTSCEYCSDSSMSMVATAETLGHLIFLSELSRSKSVVFFGPIFLDLLENRYSFFIKGLKYLVDNIISGRMVDDALVQSIETAAFGSGVVIRDILGGYIGNNMPSSVVPFVVNGYIGQFFPMAMKDALQGIRSLAVDQSLPQRKHTKYADAM